MEPEKEQKVPNWKESKGKQILRNDIISGVVTDDMPAEDVYAMSEEYQKYAYKYFRVYLRYLRSSIHRQMDAVKKSTDAFEGFLYRAKAAKEAQNEEALPDSCPPQNRSYPKWDESDAKLLLQEDIKEGRDESLWPKDLWLSRPEYQLFPLKVFRDHLYGEKNRKRWVKTRPLLRLDINDGLDEVMNPKDLYCSRIEYQDFPFPFFRDRLNGERDRIAQAQNTTDQFAYEGEEP